MKKKVIQVPVIVGKGAEQFFVEKEIKISPPSPPIYIIEQIDKKVVVTDAHVIPGKVIFNAYIWKNVAYKTVEEVCDGIVSGLIYHATFKIPFGGFVEINTIGCECLEKNDIAELLEAYVEGEKDVLFGESICKGQKVYNCLLEKDVVKIAFKVIRCEHLPICVEEEKKDKYVKKCDDKFDKEEKCIKNEKEDDCDRRYDCRGDYYARYRGSHS